MNATPTPSEPPGGPEAPTSSAAPDDVPPLAEVRDAVLRRADLVGTELSAELTIAYDRWLAQAFGDPGPGVALLAVGGLGRGEQAPYSDLDLVIVHDGRRPDVGRIAEQLWYPIWNAKVGLDHSVRTLEQAVAVAGADLKVVLGLLDMRHIAGDRALSGQLRERIRTHWRAHGLERSTELLGASRARWQSAGEAAFLLAPNLKSSRGGLRDWHSLRALSIAQLIDVPQPVLGARNTLLALRAELHRHLGRGDDELRPQEQPAVAAALGLADADAVLRLANEAGRTISYATDRAWRRVDGLRSGAPRRGGPRPHRRGTGEHRGGPFRRRQERPMDPTPERVPLADDVIQQAGEVVLARDADPVGDPGLVLRAARAAASHDLPLAPFALERLAAESAPMPTPWPASARDDLVAVLGAGPAGVTVLESLDQAGLLVALIPEWARVRIRPQRNPVHRFTVDRHLMETASVAGRLTRDVSRPDLLLLGALLHDIGKGYPGDHSVAGARVARSIVLRLGAGDTDAALVESLVAHHLLLPDTATRRDLDDPATLRLVVDAVGGSTQLLAMLHQLSIADAAATGPGAWSEWKAGLVADLVRRAHGAMTGEPPPSPEPPDRTLRQLADRGEVAVRSQDDELLVAAPDAPGLLSRTAGVLALHNLDVRSAAISTVSGTAVNRFVVQPRFGEPPAPVLLEQDLRRAIAGDLPLAERLSAKERAYRSGPTAESPPPRVLWFDEAEATDATVVELRCADSIGLLHRVTAALERCGLDIRSALVSTLGANVVDAFYLQGPHGSPRIDPAQRDRIERALLAAAVPTAVPPAPV